jgi:prevent-host-death family protein
MELTISATQARIHFGEIMQQAQTSPVLVEKDGKPVVVVLSKQAYDALVASAARRSRYELLQDAHRRVRDELGGSSLPSPEEIIRQERQARTGELGDLR